LTAPESTVFVLTVVAPVETAVAAVVVVSGLIAAAITDEIGAAGGTNVAIPFAALCALTNVAWAMVIGSPRLASDICAPGVDVAIERLATPETPSGTKRVGSTVSCPAASFATRPVGAGADVVDVKTVFPVAAAARDALSAAVDRCPVVAADAGGVVAGAPLGDNVGAEVDAVADTPLTAPTGRGAAPVEIAPPGAWRAAAWRVRLIGLIKRRSAGSVTAFGRLDCSIAARTVTGV
jgi:hypothetical protein